MHCQQNTNVLDLRLEGKTFLAHSFGTRDLGRSAQLGAEGALEQSLMVGWRQTHCSLHVGMVTDSAHEH